MLRKLSYCPDFIAKLLDLIELGALQVNTAKRYNAKQWASQLQIWFRECNEDDRFLLGHDIDINEQQNAPESVASDEYRSTDRDTRSDFYHNALTSRTSEYSPTQPEDDNTVPLPWAKQIDIHSLPTVDDDIGSIDSTETSLVAQTARDLISEAIQEDPVFKEYLPVIVRAMSKDRLIRNLLRLFKRYYLNLQTEAKDEVERKTAGLLRSRRGRLFVISKVSSNAEEVEEDTEEDETKVTTDMDLHKDRIAKVEDFLQTQPRRIDFEDELSDHSASGSEEERPVADTTAHWDIAACKNYLLKSTASGILRRDLMLMLLPTQLREVLSSIPIDDLRVSKHQPASPINRLQCWIQSNTEVKWYWWPLPQPKRELKDDDFRLEWTCTCGSLQWQEVPARYYDLVSEILRKTPKQPTSPGWCSPPSNQPPSPAFSKLVPKTKAQTHSAAAARYSPNTGQPTIMSSNNYAADGSQSTSSEIEMRNRTAPSISGAGSRQALVNNEQHTTFRRYILLGLHSFNYSFLPEQAVLRLDSQDSGVFADLKTLYDEHRGKLKLWLSIWIVCYCKITKFSKLSQDVMEHNGRSLPCVLEYNYKREHNQEGSILNPGFNEHHFRRRFYACKSRCTWRFIHRCRICPEGRQCLTRLPNREKSFKGSGSDEEVWGIEPEYAVSVARVAVYHVLLLVGPIVIFAHWISTHPDDMQTASVVLALVLGALSAFWSAGAVLLVKGDSPHL
ncbi:hypothetical protein Micbo1qcDRAFT_74301 [Microdochium bolleyi]|uniref:Uncharacterized protein n=1 Tax=Microdochium bolleyi TaxID=196109 RepID=A0A136IZ55_9PEZI|nr:hypothetical protein Micbo1qcDRAFT_74301 [Microdochium bolleyi]